jgi:hypothetical protein
VALDISYDSASSYVRHPRTGTTAIMQTRVYIQLSDFLDMREKKIAVTKFPVLIAYMRNHNFPFLHTMYYSVVRRTAATTTVYCFVIHSVFPPF